MNTPNYEIDPKDPRLQAVENEESAALISSNTAYDNMINSSDTHYNAQIQAAKDYEATQKANQQAQTDLTVQKINQQKQQAHSDYVKEQSAAYADWQKQSNKYGVNAEQQAQMGMTNTGYSESSQVSMYNTYQNRVATARESYNRAVLNYDNAIKDARLQNNALLAEIAYNTLQKQLELSLEGFQYKNNLLIEQANKKLEIENTYHNHYQDVLDQMNKENALAEEVRQHNESMAEEMRQFNAQMEEEKRQFNALHSNSGGTAVIAKTGSSGGGRRSGSGKSGGGKSGGGSGKSGITATVKNGAGEHAVGTPEKSSNPEIDMNSVLALGYGPISASKLASLEKQGLIESYTSGGKTKFRKTAYTNKQASLFMGGNISRRAY